MNGGEWLRSRFHAQGISQAEDLTPPLESVLAAAESRERRRTRVVKSAGLLLGLAVIVPLVALVFSRTPTTTGSGAVVPDVASITCGTGDTIVADASVQAQSDGVHLHLEQTGAGVNGLEIQGVTGINLSPRSTDQILSLAPGTYHLRCLTPSSPSNVAFQPLTVVDPQSLWHSPELGCTNGSGVGSGDGQSLPATPLLSLGPQIFGKLLQTDDQVVRGGYPDSSPQAYLVVVRGGVQVATANVESTPTGWLLNSVATCP